MATAYKSDAAVKGYVVRPLGYNEFTFTASCVVPAGTAIAINDTFEFFDVAPGVDIHGFVLRNSDCDDSTDIVYTLGYDKRDAADTADPDAFVATGSGTHLRAADTTLISADTLAGVAFNVIPYAITETATYFRSIKLTVTTAPVTQTTADDAARTITLTGKFFVAVPVAPATETYTPPSP
jgi:hypothetical protein